MKKSDVFCWVVVGLLLVFLWHSSSVEFFQDTTGIRGPPYTVSDATKIVNVMPAAMKAALKASARSDDPAQIIQPITPLMSDVHAVYAAATVPLTAANVDTFLQSEPIPSGLTVACPDQTHISIKGIDKQLVGQFAAEVRSLRKPEPYKGKGIRYENEQVRRKAGKAVTK
jgi:hypothetical protein